MTLPAPGAALTTLDLLGAALTFLLLFGIDGLFTAAPARARRGCASARRRAGTSDARKRRPPA